MYLLPVGARRESVGLEDLEETLRDGLVLLFLTPPHALRAGQQGFLWSPSDASLALIQMRDRTMGPSPSTSLEAKSAMRAVPGKWDRGGGGSC